MEFRVVDYEPKENFFFWIKNSNTSAEVHIYFAPYKKALLFFPNRCEHGLIQLVETPNSLARLHHLLSNKRGHLDSFEYLYIEENCLGSLVEVSRSVG